MLKNKDMLCSNCGFFCWSTQHSSGEGPCRFEEIIGTSRSDFQTGKFKGSGEDGENDETYHVSCLRKQWIWSPSYRAKAHYVGPEDVRRSRKCAYYFKYEPAYGPDEHKELQRASETNKVVFKATIFGSVIGAMVAIVAQLVYVLLTR